MKLKYKPIYTSALESYKELSTCARLKVSAILVKDGRILSMGYNGTAPGQPHCCDRFIRIGDRYYIGEYAPPAEMAQYEVSKEEWFAEHHKFSEHHEVHAEMNCIAFAIKNRIDVSGCDLIISISPCIQCAKLIAAVGIKNVYYVDDYDRNPSDGLKYLIANGVACCKLEDARDDVVRTYEDVVQREG